MIKAKGRKKLKQNSLTIEKGKLYMHYIIFTLIILI